MSDQFDNLTISSPNRINEFNPSVRPDLYVATATLLVRPEAPSGIDPELLAQLDQLLAIEPKNNKLSLGAVLEVKKEEINPETAADLDKLLKTFSSK